MKRIAIAISAVTLLVAASHVSRYDDVMQSRDGNAVVLVTLDGCSQCRQLERDIVSIMEGAGILDDSVLIVISYDRERELADKMVSSYKSGKLEFPLLFLYRVKNKGHGEWCSAGYSGKKSDVIRWIESIKRWQPSKLEDNHGK